MRTVLGLSLIILILISFLLLSCHLVSIIPLRLNLVNLIGILALALLKFIHFPFIFFNPFFHSSLIWICWWNLGIGYIIMIDWSCSLFIKSRKNLCISIVIILTFNRLILKAILSFKVGSLIVLILINIILVWLTWNSYISKLLLCSNFIGTHYFLWNLS